MATYYVKNGGSDSADGLSDANAWATVSKINGRTFSANDSILFKKGSVWREQLTMPSSGSTGQPITFSYYDSGDLPRLLGSDAKNAAGDWTWDSGNSLWYATVSATPNVVWRDGTKLTKVGTLGGVTDTGKWYWDAGNTRVYVYTTGSGVNPVTGPHTFEVAQRANGINGASGIDYVTIDGLDVRYTNEWGIHAASSGQTHWRVMNCYVTQCWYAGIHSNAAPNMEIGYNTVLYTGLVSTGNTDVQSGIAVDTAADAWIHHNTVSYTYRTAILCTGACTSPIVEYNECHHTGQSGNHGYGIQLYPYTDGAELTNAIVRYNHLHDNGHIDIYILNKVTNPEIYYNLCNLTPYLGSDWCGNLVVDLTLAGNYCSGLEFYNNTCYIGDSAYSTCNVRVLMSEDAAKMESATLKNNIFVNNESGYGFYATGTHSTPPVMDYNCYYTTSSPGGTIIKYENTDYTLATFKTAGHETHGIEDDPDFVTPGSDFHLQSTSPCRDAGVDVGLTQDIEGNTVPQ